MSAPMVTMPGGWELVLIVLVLILLFGAKKLPELARGTGRALRIFKAETRGLMEEDEQPSDDRPRSLPAAEGDTRPAERPSAEPTQDPRPTHRPTDS